MSFAKRAVMMLALSLAVAGGLWAQRPGGGGMGMMGNMPQMPGLRNPVEGSGAEYQMTGKKNGKSMDMDIATVILSKEKVDGANGLWMEQRMTSAELGGEMVTKTLMVTDGPEVGIKRMIMQSPGRPPMEMTGMMMGMMKQHQPQPQATGGGKADMGELVGTESVTVPAGTYTCQHYRKQEKDGPVDMWISSEVTPYAMVKLASADMTMVLKGILKNQTSHIKGEPQKMQMPEMPHF